MLKIGFRPSWVLVAVLALAHGAAIAVMLLVGIPWWVQAIAVAGLTVHLLAVVRRQALLLTPDAAVTWAVRVPWLGMHGVPRRPQAVALLGIFSAVYGLMTLLFDIPEAMSLWSRVRRVGGPRS